MMKKINSEYQKLSSHPKNRYPLSLLVAVFGKYNNRTHKVSKNLNSAAIDNNVKKIKTWVLNDPRSALKVAENLVKILPIRKKDLIVARFMRGESLRVLAHNMDNISPERVRQLQNDSLKIMQEHPNIKQFAVLGNLDKE